MLGGIIIWTSFSLSLSFFLSALIFCLLSIIPSLFNGVSQLGLGLGSVRLWPGQFIHLRSWRLTAKISLRFIAFHVKFNLTCWYFSLKQHSNNNNNNTSKQKKQSENKKQAKKENFALFSGKHFLCFSLSRLAFCCAHFSALPPLTSLSSLSSLIAQFSVILQRRSK